MLAAPPSNIRPTWNAETMVEPNENVSGSTSVLCWLIALVYGSELICNRVVLAAAVDVKATVSTTAPATALRRPTHRTGRTSLTLMRAPPFKMWEWTGPTRNPVRRRPGAH
jgi:hypothetical protein